MGRKKAREGAVQLVYQMEINDEFTEDSLNLFLENFDYNDSEEEYIKDSIIKIINEVTEIDKHIEENLKGWKIERLAKVDLSSIRVAVYEILFREDIPIEVSVNEAIEISKKYSEDDSYKFINGVLGGIIKSIEDNKE